jgi:hypothetical protein
MQYVTIFDLSQKGLDWFPGIIGLAFVLFGLGALASRRPGASPKLKALIPVVIGTLFGIGAMGFQISNRQHYQQVLAQGSALVVEGPIENFHPMPKQGHDTEHFTVNGVYFSYTDFSATPAFNNTSSHGGPLREGLVVRIAYTDSREFGGQLAILRIEQRR